jgi:hypothetical protein
MENIMNSTTLKDIVKDNTVKFQYYKDREFWYKVNYGENEELIFPVPIDDVGDATMMKEDKAIMFMRYIRKYLSTLEQTV